MSGPPSVPAATAVRTPLPSAPASSTITKLSIALNNLFGQFTEAVYFVSETAPPARFNGEATPEDIEKKEATDKEILTRATHIASILKAIETMSNDLPDSSRTVVGGEEYYEKRIHDIQQRSLIVGENLERSCAKAEELNDVLKEEIRRLAAELSSKDPKQM